MSVYVIGDVHGCLEAIQRLLEAIQFDTTQDSLWFTGDLVNGGPQSLETLRFVRSLGDRAACVLGNHDLTLLALARGVLKKTEKHHKLEAILQAPDRDELLAWLQNRPLLHHDETLKVTMMHAGLPPQWDLPLAKQLAREVEHVFQSSAADDFYLHLYGNDPNIWSPDLSGFARWRFVVNCLTRMRFCTAEGALNLTEKGPIDHAPPGCYPWFQVPHRRTQNDTLIFGHWSALDGVTGDPRVIAMDTGCMWGRKLTALRLPDRQCVQVQCEKQAELCC